VGGEIYYMLVDIGDSKATLVESWIRVEWTLLIAIFSTMVTLSLVALYYLQHWGGL
jgi:hypothetical protein